MFRECRLLANAIITLPRARASGTTVSGVGRTAKCPASRDSIGPCMPLLAPLVVTYGSRLSASTPWAIVSVPVGVLAAAAGEAAGAAAGGEAAGATAGEAAGAGAAGEAAGAEAWGTGDAVVGAAGCAGG